MPVDHIVVCNLICRLTSTERYYCFHKLQIHTHTQKYIQYNMVRDKPN